MEWIKVTDSQREVSQLRSGDTSVSNYMRVPYLRLKPPRPLCGCPRQSDQAGVVAAGSRQAGEGDRTRKVCVRGRAPSVYLGRPVASPSLAPGGPPRCPCWIPADACNYIREVLLRPQASTLSPGRAGEDSDTGAAPQKRGFSIHGPLPSPTVHGALILEFSVVPRLGANMDISGPGNMTAPIT